MKKEQLLLLIGDIKKHFNDNEVSQFLVSLIKCDDCPFKQECWQLTYNPPSEKFCEDIMLKVVKGVK